MPIVEQLLAVANFAIVALTVIVAVVVVFRAAERLLVARVEITAFGGSDEPAVAGMSEIVRSELVRLTDEGAGMSLFFLNGPDKPIDLPSEISSAPLGLFAEVMSWVPGQITTVTGHVQPEGALGLGVTVTLKGGWNRASASATIWERDLIVPPKGETKESKAAAAERYQRLAVAAAAWVAYQLVRNQNERARAALLTQDWLSYARFLTASRLTTQSADADTVRPVYQAALERDPRNRGALFGLGLLYGNEHANGPAAAHFDACVMEVEGAYDGADEWQRDRLWYRAKLNAGIVRMNEVALLDSGATSTVPGARLALTRDELVFEARVALANVATTAEATINDLVGHEPSVRHGPYADLVRFLVTARDYAVVTYQTSVAES